MAQNQVILSPEKDLYTKELLAKDFNWISCQPPKEPIKVTAKTRYRAKEAPAMAQALPDGTVKVVFEEPVRAVTLAEYAAIEKTGRAAARGGTERP